MVKRYKPDVSLREAKFRAQKLLARDMLVRAVSEEIQSRGLVANSSFKKLLDETTFNLRLINTLPLLGFRFKGANNAFPYAVVWRNSAPFVLATASLMLKAKATAKRLSPAVYTSLTTEDGDTGVLNSSELAV